MSDDMSEMLNSVKKMVDSGNIPDNLKEMLDNFNNSNSNNNSNNDISSMLSSFLSSNNSNTNSDKDSSNHSSNDFNIDMNTILKMKSIIETMNKKDDPRANLLHSLKPYLRESKKNKLDQYVNLLNMTKLADIMKKANNNNA